MGEDGSEENTHLSVDIAVDDSVWLEPPPFEFELVGMEVDGEINVGISSLDPSPAHHDIVPESVYSDVVEVIDDYLDWPYIKTESSADTALKIGECKIDRGQDGDLEAFIDLHTVATK